MGTPPFGSKHPGQEDHPTSTSNRQKAPEPTPAQITLAKQFLSDVLGKGPQLTRDVERVARQQGHAKRTLDRARALLGVQKLPPDRFRGPWRIALKNDKAVDAYKQRKEAKNQKARERQGNEQKRWKHNGGGRKLRNKQLAPVR